MRINNDKTLILNRIKLHYGFKSDAEFARFLGIKPNSLSNWYTRNTIDYDLVFSKCEDINLEWLLSGNDSQSQNENVEKNISESIAAEPTASYGVDEWKNKYEQLSEKYTALLEQHNALLTNKLKEVLKDKSAV